MSFRGCETYAKKQRVFDIMQGNVDYEILQQLMTGILCLRFSITVSKHRTPYALSCKGRFIWPHNGGCQTK